MRRSRSILLGASLVLAAAAPTLAAGPASATSTTSSSTTSSSVFLSGSTHYPFVLTEPGGFKVTIKKRPTRIIAVDEPVFSVDDMEALGLKPMAAETGFVDPAAPTITQSVGVSGGPDLEKIAALHPDLIVGSQGSGTGDIKELEAIAPVADVAQDSTPYGTQITNLQWYPDLRLIAQVLDRETQFNAFIAKFEAAAAAVRPKLEGKTVRVISGVGPTGVVVEGPGQGDGYDLPLLGLKVLPIPPGGSSYGDIGLPQVTSLSDERALELTGQYLFVAAQTKASLDTFIDNPVAARLPSVEAGRVVAGVGPGSPEFGGASLLGSYGELVALPALAKAFETAGA